MTVFRHEIDAVLSGATPILIQARSAPAASLTASLSPVLKGLLSVHEAWLVLDASGLVCCVSPTFTERMRDVLRIDHDGGVRAAHPAGRSAFETFLADARDETTAGARSLLFLERADGGRAAGIEAISLGPVGLLLVLRDVFAPAKVCIARHLVTLGLTPAEARVAMRVGRGAPPSEVARRLAVSEETVRAQLRATFSKLGLSRQSELAVLVTRLELCASRA